MSLMMRRHNGRPMLAARCDVCLKPLTDTLLSAYCWGDYPESHPNHEEPVIHFACKGLCLDRIESLIRERGGHFLWMELAYLPEYFGRAFGVPVEATWRPPHVDQRGAVGWWGVEYAHA